MIAPIITLNFTLDHRFIDGGAALKAYRAVIKLFKYSLKKCSRIQRGIHFDIFNKLHNMNTFISKYSIALAHLTK